MSRELALYLRDILGAVWAIQAHTRGLTLEGFRQDRLRLDAVAYNLIVIGEAASKVPGEAQARYAEIPWAQVGEEGAEGGHGQSR